MTLNLKVTRRIVKNLCKRTMERLPCCTNFMARSTFFIRIPPVSSAMPLCCLLAPSLSFSLICYFRFASDGAYHTSETYRNPCSFSVFCLTQTSPELRQHNQQSFMQVTVKDVASSSKQSYLLIVTLNYSLNIKQTFAAHSCHSNVSIRL